MIIRAAGVSLDRSGVGEVCVIVGPSGGGKTTFLRCLNGLGGFHQGEIDWPESSLRGGSARVAQAAVGASAAVAVGMVFQQFNLFPHRTALGNVIEAPMHVLGYSRQQATSEADDVCRASG